MRAHGYRRCGGQLVLLGLVLLSAPAAAAEAELWLRAWRAENLSALVPPGTVRLMVTGAGANPTDTAAAVDALEEAFRGLTPPPVVVDRGALGSVEGLSDAEIGTRAAGLPFDRLVIVRHAAGPPEHATAVAYGVDGRRLSSLLVMRDAPVPERDPVAARLAYATRALEVEAWEIRETRRDSLVNVKYRYYQGDEELDLATFYERAGRADLSKKVREQDPFRGMGPIVAVGALAAVVVAGLAVSTVSPSIAFNIWAAGVASVLGGTVVFGLIVPPDGAHPINEEAEAELAATYNRQLLHELGLTEEPPEVAKIRARRRVH